MESQPKGKRKVLPTSQDYHSTQVDVLSEKFTKFTARVKFRVEVTPHWLHIQSFQKN